MQDIKDHTVDGNKGQECSIALVKHEMRLLPTLTPMCRALLVDNDILGDCLLASLAIIVVSFMEVCEFADKFLCPRFNSLLVQLLA